MEDQPTQLPLRPFDHGWATQRHMNSNSHAFGSSGRTHQNVKDPVQPPARIGSHAAHIRQKVMRRWRWLRGADDVLPFLPTEGRYGNECVKVAHDTATRFRDLHLLDELVAITNHSAERGTPRRSSHYRAIHRAMQRAGFRWTFDARYARSGRYFWIHGYPQMLFGVTAAGWAFFLVTKADEGWAAAIASAIAIFVFTHGLFPKVPQSPTVVVQCSCAR